MPCAYEPLHFGLGDSSEGEYDGVIALYALPFRRLARTARAAADASDEDLTDCDSKNR